MKDQTCIVQLGRFGDIINILPIAKHLCDTESKPALLLSTEYSSIGDGIGYADVISWDGDWNEIHPAIGWAKQNYTNVIPTQAWAKGWTPERLCDAFNVEQWRLAGYLPMFGKLPLEFDRRDARREQTLVKRVVKDTRPILFSSVGMSSPYVRAGELLNRLKERFDGQHPVVDLSLVRGARLFDLLGLYDVALCLVTIDTATLHLAAASHVPVIALIADRPDLWNGSRPPNRTVLSMRYYESQFRMDDIIDAITSLDTAPPGKLIHVYSMFNPVNCSDQRRHALARRTWTQLHSFGNWVDLPVPDESLPRTFSCSGRKLPYVKDLFRLGAGQCGPDDILVMTNIDICLSNDCSVKLAAKISDCGCAFAFRRDFGMIGRPLTADEINKGQHYEGTDLFACTRRWWENYGEKLPDLVLAAEYWDQCLRELMIRTTKNGSPEVKGVIYHERHPTVWNAHRYAIPSQQHNRKLAIPFLKGLGVPQKEISK